MEEKIKNTKWLIASLVAIMVSAMMAGCGGSSGTPPPDSNTTTGGGGDDNTTTGGSDDNATGGGTEVANTKLTIQKSDLGDCQDMRVQVWALEYEAEANSKLFGLVEFTEGNITDGGDNYSVEIPADKIPQTNFYHAHATIFCGERSWGMKSLSYDMDNTSQGFYKSWASLVVVFGRTFPEWDDPDFPDELAPSYDTHRVVLGVASSRSIYTDPENNSSESVDRLYGIQNGYEAGESNYLYNNLESDMYHFDTNNDWGFSGYGYIDSGASRHFGNFSEGQWYATKVRWFNGEITYSNIIFKTEGEAYLNFGVENYPSWMPEP